MRDRKHGTQVAACAVLAGAWLAAGGCSTTSKSTPTNTRTATKVAGTSTFTFSNTRTPTPLASATFTPPPCAGSVACNPTWTASPTQIPWGGGATVSVNWQTSGCIEVTIYEQNTTLSGFSFVSGTVVSANSGTDDGHVHASSANPGSGSGIWDNPNGRGTIDMGPVPINDPSMLNAPDPGSNAYPACCGVQVIPGHSYFIRIPSNGFAKVHIVCVDLTATGSSPGVRYQWEWGN